MLNKNEQPKIIDIEEAKEKKDVVENKPLIEIIGEYEKKIQDSKYEATTIPYKNIFQENRERTSVVEEGNTIIDHDNKVIKYKPKKPLKMVPIKEIASTSTRDKEVKKSDAAKEIEHQPSANKDNKSKTSDKKKEETIPTGKIGFNWQLYKK